MNDMRRKLSILIAVIAIILIVGGLFYLSPRIFGVKNWSAYTSSTIGVSFEYPSNELTPEPEGSYGTTTVRIDNNHEIGASNTDVSKIKMVIAEMVPTNATEVASLDDWIKIVENNKSPGGSPFTNAQFTTIDGERAAVTHSTVIEGNTYGTTDVTVFHGGKIYQMVITNLSPEETERVWKSLKFLN